MFDRISLNCKLTTFELYRLQIDRIDIEPKIKPVTTSKGMFKYLTYMLTQKLRIEW